MNKKKLEGLWSVEFGVPAASTYGAGIIIFFNGGIYGGDAGYYYIGKYDLDEQDNVTAHISVKHHYGPKNNVLGQGIGEIDLDLKGVVKPDKFTVSNGQFMAVLTRRENLIA